MSTKVQDMQALKDSSYETDLNTEISKPEHIRRLRLYRRGGVGGGGGGLLGAYGEVQSPEGGPQRSRAL